MTPEIREAVPRDQPQIFNLLGAQFAEHHIELEAGSLHRVIDGVFAEPRRGRFLVAAEGDQLIGLAYLAFNWTLEHGGSTLWLEELYVRPEARNQGLGTRLVEAVLEFARRAGVIAIDLEVEEDHSRVEGLYTRMGFRSHTRRRWFRKV